MKAKVLFFILMGTLPSLLFSSEVVVTKDGETYINIKDIDSKEVRKIVKSYRRSGEYENIRTIQELENQHSYEYVDLESMESKVQRVSATGTVRD